MKLEGMKKFIKENGKVNLVNELVTGAGFEVEEAVEYVYDMNTLTKEEFARKYFC